MNDITFCSILLCDSPSLAIRSQFHETFPQSCISRERDSRLGDGRPYLPDEHHFVANRQREDFTSGRWKPPGLLTPDRRLARLVHVDS